MGDCTGIYKPFSVQGMWLVRKIKPTISSMVMRTGVLSNSSSVVFPVREGQTKSKYPWPKETLDFPMSCGNFLRILYTYT